MERFAIFFDELYENFNNRKIESVVAHTTENVQWANGMEGGYVYGHNGLRDYWTRQFTMINPRVIPLNITAEDDVVKIKVHQLVHDLNGQVILNKNVYHYFHMDHNKIARFDIGDEVVE